MFNFSIALEKVKEGKAVARAAWNNPGIKVLMQTPDENSKMTEPYLYMEKRWHNEDDTVGGMKRFPLDLSAESIFADDWFEVTE